METQLATKPHESTALQIDLDQVASGLTKIKAFQGLVRKSLVPDHDYGVIPGTQKPSLWKPGAEKLCKLLSLSDSYVVEDKVENWDQGFFAYTIRCELKNISDGNLIAQGLGSCNSKEARYRYRWVFGSEVPSHIEKDSLVTKHIRTRKGKKATMYRIENDDPYSLVNTLLKMAKKRAMVDATLSAGRLSDIFSQGGDPPRPGEDENATLPQRREQMFSYFKSQGVAKQRVLDFLSVTRSEEIGLEMLHRLRDIATQVSNGAVSVNDVFGLPDDQTPATGDAEPEPPAEDSSTEADEPDFGSDPEPSGPSLADQKAKLIGELVDHLSKLHPEDNAEDQAARLRILKDTFAKTVIDDIGKMPLQIIEAGVKMIAQKAAELEGASE